MLPKRMRISKGATDNLKLLKGRTGLTPNFMCRMALLISLEQGPKGGSKVQELTGSEFNAPTLFGEFGYLFEALIRQVHGELDSKQCAFVIASHIDDGLTLLKRAKSINELLQHTGLATA